MMKEGLILSIFLMAIGIVHGQISIDLNTEKQYDVNNLIGFNTGFDHRHWVEKESAAGITTYTSTLRQDVLSEITKINKPVLRFPGGVIANFYHLYEEGHECQDDMPCVDQFAKGYGLRQKEVLTFNNGFGAVGGEYGFEQNDNFELSQNWIEVFANMVLEYQSMTNEQIEVVYMANVVSHFKFGNQGAQFNGNTPLVNSESFKRSLLETRHALKFLMNKGINVTKIELGTELYFNNWFSKNDVTIDRFIQLIPIYRKLLDDHGFEDIEIGVPISHTQSLNPNADNWTRKLVDQSYNPNQMYDAWIIHDYQRMVEPCTVVLGNCNNCTNWEDDECTLYDGNTNILNCEPKNHSPSSEELENVFKKKNERFSDYFNQGLVQEYQEKLVQLRALSGKDESAFWLTEWNEIFDAGCTQWKGINKFFPNTFAHGVNIFELLHSMYRQNALLDDPFIEIATFHTLSAPNSIYPVINAQNDVSNNATYYPFQMTSLINQKDLKYIDAKVESSYSSSELNVYPYASKMVDSVQNYYLFYSNKTPNDIEIDYAINGNQMNQSSDHIRYVHGASFHSSVNGEYIFNSKNVTTNPIDYTYASQELNTSKRTFPAMTFGYVRITNDISTSNDLLSHRKAPSIYPVPVSNHLYIKGLTSRTQKMTIYDTFGNALTSFNRPRREIDVSLLNKGVYFLKIEENNTHWILRFTKL